MRANNTCKRPTQIFLLMIKTIQRIRKKFMKSWISNGFYFGLQISSQISHSLINSITKKFNNHQIKYSAVFWLIWNVIMYYDIIALALHAWVICHMFIIYSNRFVSNARFIWSFRLKRSNWALVFFFFQVCQHLCSKLQLKIRWIFFHPHFWRSLLY